MSFWGVQNRSIKAEFSDSESFRLCTEGLQALELYQREPSKSALDLAEERFKECVERYPRDVLPKFYLGSVETLSGYRGLDAAVEHLEEVVRAKAGPADMRFAAKYNLAVANIERYDDIGFEKAETILRELVVFESGDPVRDRMVWLARATRLYIFAHRLWEHRKGPTEDDLAKVHPLLSEFSDFESALNVSSFSNDSMIQAEYWNALAYLYETRAHYEHDRTLGEQARAYYEKALSYRPGYIGYRENLAVLYQEVFGDWVKAREIWEELLKIWPDGDYIHLNLGRIYRADAKQATDGRARAEALAKAREHYSKASKIAQAREELLALPKE